MGRCSPGSALGLRRDDPMLAYFEWSPDREIDTVSEGDATNPMIWAESNPALGIRIAAEHVALEQRSMDPRTFAVERLNVGDWPDPRAAEGDGITVDAWRALVDERSSVEGAVCFAFDVRPNRSAAAICAAGTRVPRQGIRRVWRVDAGAASVSGSAR